MPTEADEPSATVCAEVQGEERRCTTLNNPANASPRPRPFYWECETQLYPDAT